MYTTYKQEQLLYKSGVQSPLHKESMPQIVPQYHRQCWHSFNNVNKSLLYLYTSIFVKIHTRTDRTMSAFVWIPLTVGTYFIGRGYLVANQAIYTQLKVALEYQGYKWPDQVGGGTEAPRGLEDSQDAFGTFTQARSTESSKGWVKNIGSDYAKLIGDAMGIGVGVLSYSIVYKTVKRQLTNPSDLLQNRKSMRAAVENAKPLPPPLTPRRFYQYLAPHKITRTSFREFNRLYSRTILIHWLALTWAVVFASIAQPLLESRTICDCTPRSGKHPKEIQVSFLCRVMLENWCKRVSSSLCDQQEKEDEARFAGKRKASGAYD
eukprot:gb/GECG01007267.1/.p1 GENE.gb/GECG01007267.1/~~gb/GECG01007267.1/.p1  ORF type:complete len:321 (+),score=23.49 gb/GECG01007267.1/:1-963(+)